MDISKERIKQIIKEEIGDIQAHPDHPDLEDDNQEWSSVKAHLEKIHSLSRRISNSMQEPEDVEEWIQEKVAVVAAILHSIEHYQEEEKVRSS